MHRKQLIGTLFDGMTMLVRAVFVNNISFCEWLKIGAGALCSAPRLLLAVIGSVSFYVFFPELLIGFSSHYDSVQQTDLTICRESLGKVNETVVTLARMQSTVTPCS